MNGNPEVLTVSFVNDRLKLRDGQVLVGRYLDHVDVLEFVLPDCLAGAVYSIDQQEFLLQDRGGEAGFRFLKVFTLRDQLTSREAKILGPEIRFALIASRSSVSPSIPE